jgi:hypothetical protein
MQGFVYSVALARPLTKVMPQADGVELRFHLPAEQAVDGRARA